jgi:hypothetical protein
MKRAIIQTFVVLVTLANGALAQGMPPLPPPEQDPFVGTWRANRDKSRPKLDDTDASYVRTISREGDEIVFSSRITLFERHRKVVEHHYRYRCDGQPHRLPQGSLSCIYKAPNLIEKEASSPDGKVYLTEEVSANGQEVRILAYENKTKTKLMSVWVMDRVN